MGKKTLRLGWFTLVTLMIAAFFAVEAQAGIKPCCEGGTKPAKFCTFDNDCPDACVGGAHDGQSCASANCPDACVGGKKEGNVCSSDGDCPGSCTLNNTTCFTNADCTSTGGGACGPVGSCSNVGTCANPGACSGQCLSKGKGPKNSPGDPVNAGDDVGEAWDEYLASNEATGS